MNDDSSIGRVASALRSWIETAPSGARLPSTRAIVAQHAVGPATVQQAIARLNAEGLVEPRPGVGTFVRARRATRAADVAWQGAALGRARPLASAVPTPLRSADPGVLTLHGGYPDRELLPERLVRAALTRAARGEASTSRPPVAGLAELRGWFAAELGSYCPSAVSAPTASDVVVVPGSQSGLTTVLRALAGSGRPVLIESPTYWGAILAARHAGVDLVPVPSGAGGPDLVELDRAFEETGARVFYAQPTYANPTGAQWTRAVSEQVLELVRRHRAFLVEDDWARDFAISTTPRPIAALDHDGHVVHLRSLTKSVSPAVRVAAVIARGPAAARLQADQAAESMYVSGLLQTAALDVVHDPGWRSHLRRLRGDLEERRDLLLHAVRRHAPQAVVEHPPAGGLNLWARLPDRLVATDVVARCEARGLLVAGGDDWFPAEPSGSYLRLNYAGPHAASFDEAARRLGEGVEAAEDALEDRR